MLVSWPFSFEFLSKMVFHAPQCRVWALSLCFLHFVWLSIITSVVFMRSSNLLDLLDFVYHAPALRGQLWWLRIFFYAPQYCLGTFNRWGFFCVSRTCPPVWGVILAKVISKNFSRLKRGLQMIYFSLVNGLSKMVFPHVKHIQFGSVSLAFMRVCNVISHYSFK